MNKDLENAQKRFDAMTDEQKVKYITLMTELLKESNEHAENILKLLKREVEKKKIKKLEDDIKTT